MEITLQTQLFPDKKQASQLRAAIERFNAAADWLAEQAFARKLTNKTLLQKLCYGTLRERFGLSSQMACLCVARVVAAYKRDKKKQPKFRKLASMPYDSRILSFRGSEAVSLLTLEGRITIPLAAGELQKERLTKDHKQCLLMLRKDGKWFLSVVVEAAEAPAVEPIDYIGIDLGVVNIATTHEGDHKTGDEIEKVRTRYHERVQKAAAIRKRRGHRPKQIRQALKRMHKREARFRADVNHRISKQLVAMAKGTQRGIALEDLKGIRGRTRFRKRQRARMSGWAFYQLRAFIEYKAKLAGVPITLVDPKNTSRECSKCHHVEKANRVSQSEFRCRKCGFAIHADTNGARCIRARAIVNLPMVSERHVVTDLVA